MASVFSEREINCAGFTWRQLRKELYRFLQSTNLTWKPCRTFYRGGIFFSFSEAKADLKGIVIEPDMKLFSCYAKNPHVSGTASTTHKLRVVYSPKPPIILGYDAGTPLQVGDLQKFNCVAVGGNPPAMLSWYKGDREVS
ncbi:ig-like domain-containing protein [Caerostris extrusa]|uniref:Ig-like domain-containing protein n=1 Tax=Caerostris extrusa TaxID=172846 RepID=A0AAV4Y233_CAEEX|nr:ig-like domain-containing protein [Caerostris extrusa]